MDALVVNSGSFVGVEAVEHERKPITCPRCGTVHLLLPGEMVSCRGESDSPYASRGICCLNVGRVGDNE